MVPESAVEKNAPTVSNVSEEMNAKWGGHIHEGTENLGNHPSPTRKAER